MVLYRKIELDELSRDLFIAFRRRQVVTNCWRKENGIWIVKPAPFIDDWSEDDYAVLVRCLRNTLLTDGLVYGAFVENELKGFVSVEGTPIGAHSQYLDLSSIHVSEDMRGHGIGRELFAAAKRFAKGRHAQKLYISAHSSVETQAFYRAMGCVEAKEYNLEHAEKEPYDCQLECEL